MKIKFETIYIFFIVINSLLKLHNFSYLEYVIFFVFLLILLIKGEKKEGYLINSLPNYKEY